MRNEKIIIIIIIILFFLCLNMIKYNNPVSYFGNKINDIKHFKEFLPFE